MSTVLAPDVALSASPFEGMHDLAVPLLPERGCSLPIASIFYDAIPLRYKETYLTDDLLSNYYQRRLNAYSGFDDNLCISAFSLSELRSFHPRAKAVSIAAGVSQNVSQNTKFISGDHLDFGDFVLYVGALDWRKNIDAIVRAFGYIDKVWPRNGLKLVIAGDAPVKFRDGIVEFWKGWGLMPTALFIWVMSRMCNLFRSTSKPECLFNRPLWKALV